MILTPLESLITIGVIALGTFFTRVLPFILFPGNKKTPDFIEYLGMVLPYSIIGMLVVYCLKSVSISSFPFGIPEFIAIAFVILIHKWKHNTLLSIGGGTVVYMILVQMVFPS